MTIVASGGGAVAEIVNDTHCWDMRCVIWYSRLQTAAVVLLYFTSI